LERIERTLRFSDKISSAAGAGGLNWGLTFKATTFAFFATGLFGQTPLNWQQLKTAFKAANPMLKAAQLNIDESRAAEITAYLRPNPDFSLAVDGLQVSRNGGVWRPFSGIVETPSVSYLHERKHKRELRLETAKRSTDIAASTYLDQERGLIFNLRNAFVQTLQAKAVLENAKQNLEYWDRELTVNRTRFNAGDLALVDLNRLELQRVQFESDYETAYVGMRTAKIQLLMLLNQRTPLERFDVTGPFDFSPELMPLEEFRAVALENRPDLKAAGQMSNWPRPTTSWRSPTARRIRRSASGIHIILRLATHTPTRRWAEAWPSLSVSSTGIKVRRRARRSTSAATSGS
jgi:cobalt-zinc-cadmium efflux system outer membrane protein